MSAEHDLVDLLIEDDNIKDNEELEQEKQEKLKKIQMKKQEELRGQHRQFTKKRKRGMSSINLGELQKLKYALRIINEKIDDDSLSIYELDDLLDDMTKLQEKIRQIRYGKGRTKYKRKKKSKKRTKKRTTK